LKPTLKDIDLVCLMSVNPGFGGQKFIEYTYKKIAELRKMINEQGSRTRIEVDGGVTEENAKRIIEAGADVLVAGNTVFKSSDPKKTISALRNI
jgi:ribulose-phosphate 3-epimerase